jgi:hypothetical protein
MARRLVPAPIAPTSIVTLWIFPVNQFSMLKPRPGLQFCS